VKAADIAPDSFIPQDTKVYSIDGLASPIRHFGEPPQHNCMLIRVVLPDGTETFRALAPRELWRIQDLPLHQYAQLCKIADAGYAGATCGAAIPLRLLHPPAALAIARMQQHTAYRTAQLHPQVPSLHWNSPTVQHLHSALLVLVCATDPPLALLLADGSVIGSQLQPPHHSRKHATALANRWLTHLGIDGTAEHVVAGTSLHYHITMAVVPFTPTADIVATTPGELQHIRSKHAWASSDAIRHLPAWGAVEPALLKLESYRRPLSAADAAKLSDNPNHLMGAAAPAAIQPRLIGNNTSTTFDAAITDDAAAITALRDEFKNIPEHDPLWPELHGFYKAITGADASDIQPGLRTTASIADDPLIMSVEFPERLVPCTTQPLPYIMRQQAPDWRPSSPRRIYAPIVFDFIIPMYMRHLAEFLYECRDKLPGEAVRRSNLILCVGPELILPEARGPVWDAREWRPDPDTLEGPGIEPLDFAPWESTGAAHIDTHLNVQALLSALDGYSDHALPSHLQWGVRLGADLGLELCVFPHLLSLSLGFQSVQSELARLAKLGWYQVFKDIPFYPIKANPQGSRARKLTSNYRRTTDMGAPRKDVYPIVAARTLPAASPSTPQDEPGLDFTYSPHRIRSSNEAARDVDRPREIKVLLSEVMVACCILLHAAWLLGTHLYTFGDDFKDYFNQLKTHPSSHWQTCMVTLPLDLAHDNLVWVVETVLGFGYVAASNVAQRLSDALVWVFEKRFDAEEEALFAASNDPKWASWRTQRREQCKAPGAARLYWLKAYTDDVRGLAVHPHRMWRMVRLWAQMMKEFNFIMADAVKRELGTRGVFIGAQLYTTLGLLQLMEQKVLLALGTIKRTLAGECEVGDYSRLLGRLQNFLFLTRMDSSYFHGLYVPLRAGNEADDGPGARVRPTHMIRYNMRRWAAALISAPGAPFTAALPELPATHLPATVFYMYSDAAKKPDEPHDVPGMGGCMHGLWWHVPLTPDTEHLTIPALELLAFVGNVIHFHPHMGTGLGLTHRILANIDALGSRTALHSRPSSHGLQYILHEMRLLPQLVDALPHIHSNHVFGVGNDISDWASRGRFSAIEAELQRKRMRSRRLQPDPAFITLVKRVANYYLEHNERNDARNEQP